MSKIQSWIIVFLFAVLTVAVCWHFYRTDQYHQEQLSIERVGLGRGSGKDEDPFWTRRGISNVHDFLKRDKQVLAARNKPPPTPSMEK